MPTPITTEVWSLIGQWLIYGSSICGAVLAVAKFVSWLRSKTTVAKLEEDVKRHAELLASDNTRIKKLENQASNVDDDLRDMHDLLRLNTKAQQAIMKALLDGNNKENVQRVSDEIQDYMNRHI